MRHLLIAPAAVMVALASAPVAHSQDGAQRLPCPESRTGATSVLTPDGNGHTTSNANSNCGDQGPAAGGGAAVISCSLVSPGWSGNIVVAPSGNTMGHCNAP